jgi:hypothetical protein
MNSLGTPGLGVPVAVSDVFRRDGSEAYRVSTRPPGWRDTRFCDDHLSQRCNFTVSTAQITELPRFDDR